MQQQHGQGEPDGVDVLVDRDLERSRPSEIETWRPALNQARQHRTCESTPAGLSREQRPGPLWRPSVRQFVRARSAFIGGRGAGCADSVAGAGDGRPSFSFNIGFWRFNSAGYASRASHSHSGIRWRTWGSVGVSGGHFQPLASSVSASNHSCVTSYPTVEVLSRKVSSQNRPPLTPLDPHQTCSNHHSEPLFWSGTQQKRIPPSIRFRYRLR
jgi:hypothetical protein